MLISLIDKNCAKILLYMAISPGSRHTRTELKAKTLLNNVPLDYSLSKLALFNLINREKGIYSLNLENNAIKLLMEERKRIANLPSRVQFILIDFLDYSSRIRQIMDVRLFGSYSKLIFHENSDIDIAVIFSDNAKSRTKLEKNIFLIQENLSKKYKKEIEAHYFSESDMKHKEDPLIKDILRNGISLI